MRLPSTNPVTLPYGATSAPYTPTAPHAGTDYAGSDLNSYAPEKVIITAYYPYDGVNPCGNQLDFKSVDGTRTYRFCHSSKVLVKAGQTCEEGSVLAIEGAVGLAFGVHLHFVMWVKGIRVDGDKTIKSMTGGSMTTSRDDAIWLYRNLGVYSPTETQKVKWTGRNLTELLKQIYADPGWTAKREKIAGYDALLAENTELKKQLANEGTTLAPGKYNVK